jgi:hypothetical protein
MVTVSITFDTPVHRQHRMLHDQGSPEGDPAETQSRIDLVKRDKREGERKHTSGCEMKEAGCEGGRLWQCTPSADIAHRLSHCQVGSGGREDRLWCAVPQRLCNMLVDSAHEQDPTQKKLHEQERLFRTSYSDPQPSRGVARGRGASTEEQNTSHSQEENVRPRWVATHQQHSSTCTARQSKNASHRNVFVSPGMISTLFGGIGGMVSSPPSPPLSPSGTLSPPTDRQVEAHKSLQEVAKPLFQTSRSGTKE